MSYVSSVASVSRVYLWRSASDETGKGHGRFCAAERPAHSDSTASRAFCSCWRRSAFSSRRLARCNTASTCDAPACARQHVSVQACRETGRTDLLIEAVLLFGNVVHAARHRVDFRRNTVHLGVEGPEAAQHLVILLDGLSLPHIARPRCAKPGRKARPPAVRVASDRRAYVAFQRWLRFHPKIPSPGQSVIPRGGRTKYINLDLRKMLETHLAQAALVLVRLNAVGQSPDLFCYELDYRLLLLQRSCTRIDFGGSPCSHGSAARWAQPNLAFRAPQ